MLEPYFEAQIWELRRGADCGPSKRFHGGLGRKLTPILSWLMYTYVRIGFVPHVIYPQYSISISCTCIVHINPMVYDSDIIVSPKRPKHNMYQSMVIQNSYPNTYPVIRPPRPCSSYLCCCLLSLAGDLLQQPAAALLSPCPAVARKVPSSNNPRHILIIYMYTLTLTR